MQFSDAQVDEMGEEENVFPPQIMSAIQLYTRGYRGISRKKLILRTGLLWAGKLPTP